MHFYERIKQKFIYIYLFVLARRFYRFLKNFPNVGYDILERGYRYVYIIYKIFLFCNLLVAPLYIVPLHRHHFALEALLGAEILLFSLRQKPRKQLEE